MEWKGDEFIQSKYSYYAPPSGLMVPIFYQRYLFEGSNLPCGAINKRTLDLDYNIPVYAVAICNTKKHVFIGSGGCVEMRNIAGCRRSNLVSILHEFPNENDVISLKLSLDGNMLIAGSGNRLVVWDVGIERPSHFLDSTVPTSNALAISPDSRFCYNCGSNGNVEMWDIHNKIVVALLRNHQAGVTDLVLSPNGIKLWTASLDKTIRVWDIRQNEQVDQHNFSCGINSLAICPTGKWIAAGLMNSSIDILHTDNIFPNRFVMHLHNKSVSSLKFAHSGEWLISTGMDGLCYIWRTPHGPYLFQIEEPTGILSCDISADDQFIVIGSKQTTVYEINKQNEQQKKTMI